MALPKRRHSHSRTRKRRSHDALKVASLSTCKECGEVKQPHRLCPGCGSYAGRKVYDLEEEALD